ncbi:MAG: pyridoxine 5'-phosphate synthase [Candidatus Omnitrophica bacterium]|nr:pyridoxine 5'-phosphate synthase [Candidatus Omnitrophota bacterium]
MTRAALSELSPPRLGVNVDHIATVRQARLGDSPDPVEAALACVRAGADRIVCHLREDHRHIQPRDVERLRGTVHVPLNLELSMADEVVAVALRLRPASVTLVPERRQELTTEGGLDVRRHFARLKRLVKQFQNQQIAVSFFIDPIEDHVIATARSGANQVELHTGRYARAVAPAQRKAELAQLRRAAQQAKRRGLLVAAGHGLDYHNVAPVAALREVAELNIGFSIIARAVFVGVEQAVREMRALIQRRPAA